MLSRFLVFLLSSFLLISFVPTNTAGAEDTDVQLFKVQLAVAKKGNPRAQYYLGEMHEQGLGTKQDVDEAFKWYNKAAEKGDPLAQRKLALREEIVTEIKKEQEAERVKAITAPAKTTIIEKSEKPEKQEKPAKTVITGKPEKQESPAKPEIPVKPADKGKSGPESVSVAVVEKTEAEREIARIRDEKKEQRRAAVRKMLRDMQKNAPGELFE
jgi:TPR repeat protein